MILTLDVGNSAVKGALFDGDEIASIFHLNVNVAEPGTEAAEAWRRALREAVGTVSVERAGVATVVPDVLPAAEEINIFSSWNPI